MLYRHSLPDPGPRKVLCDRARTNSETREPGSPASLPWPNQPEITAGRRRAGYDAAPDPDPDPDLGSAHISGLDDDLFASALSRGRHDPLGAAAGSFDGAREGQGEGRVSGGVWRGWSMEMAEWVDAAGRWRWLSQSYRRGPPGDAADAAGPRGIPDEADESPCRSGWNHSPAAALAAYAQQLLPQPSPSIPRREDAMVDTASSIPRPNR
ncbi:hypothetical protein JHW43_005565 [Diplocarpon mali]|nr:hypothetical protein JHW43_005565 [Diplocarpon mali]